MAALTRNAAARLALALAVGAALAPEPGHAEPAWGRSAAMSEVETLYRRAHDSLERKRADYQGTLLRSLVGGSPYQRHLALERLVALGRLPDDAGVPMLVPLLEENMPLPPAEGSGPPTSNGALAAKLLTTREASGPIVAAIVARPSSAEAMLASLAAGRVRSEAILDALAAPASLAARASLLRLALGASACAVLQPRALAPVIALENAADPVVRRLVPPVVLRLTHCKSIDKSLEPARKRATEAIAARLADAADAEVVGDIARLEDAGQPLVPALIDRLEHRARDRDQRRALVQALGDIWQGAPEATPLLLRMLRDPADRPLRSDLLFALGAVGGATADVKPTLLGIAATDPDSFTATLEALLATYTSLTAAELMPLATAYRKNCATKPAPACERQERALRQLADLAQLTFDPIDHDKPQ